ncbi:hypothetical protein GCM10010306_000340 [Streptomyces umbrinus]|nr:hypothetical protein GCM10010306_000340 [Streptomyces umbrinus]GHH44091.1 hypothetical protein GCM10018775_31250 [Streptomyces umbrinus]
MNPFFRAGAETGASERAGGSCTGMCGLPFSLTDEGSCSGGGEGSGAAGFIA